MKVIILAGGFGTRLAEHTSVIPKPMIPIGNKPIIHHIMQRYAKYGHRDFYLALGYKAEVIKEYFMKYRSVNSDMTVDLATGDIVFHRTEPIDWRVNLIDTGHNTMTGGRVRRLQKFIGAETFMLTYGDGLSSIDLDALLAFHKSQGKLVTVTAVRPQARFGELSLSDAQVTSFQEKPQLREGWINGGFFVMEPSFFSYIRDDSTVLEREPLSAIADMGEMAAYKHGGFWQCVDTKRDLDMVESIWNSGEVPWL